MPNSIFESSLGEHLIWETTSWAMAYWGGVASFVWSRITYSFTTSTHLLPGGTERGRREACRRATRTRIKCKGIHLSLDTQMEDVYKHKRACLNLRTFITANMCSKQYTSWPTVLQELQWIVVRGMTFLAYRKARKINPCFLNRKESKGNNNDTRN